MPRPVFDIEQYELRGILPEVFTEEQQKRLNLVTSRVNGQIDWTAQLLGYSGPSYWGKPDPKADGSYNWRGLPDTINEKRMLQTGAFGVYDKDKLYDDRPRPFNRQFIAASGDYSFTTYEKDGKTYLSPAAGDLNAVFPNPAIVFRGGSYTFDRVIEADATSGSDDNSFKLEYFTNNNVTFTRIWIAETASTNIGIRILDSLSAYTYLMPIAWEDISDWRAEETKNNFIGSWGNKGNNFSMDFQFDALDLHGYDENLPASLQRVDAKSCISLETLLAQAGLKPTIWTPFWPTKFGFQIDDSVVFYPLPACENYFCADDADLEAVVLESGDFVDKDIELETSTDVIEAENLIPGNGQPGASQCLPLNSETIFFEYQTCNYSITVGETVKSYTFPDVAGDDIETCDGTAIGLDQFCFDFGKVNLFDPCINWVFDPTLDDGIYFDPGEQPHSPEDPGAWATADDGEYDQNPALDCIVAAQGSCDSAICTTVPFCSFNDGIYDEQVEPNCDPEDDPLAGIVCFEIDGGQYNTATLTTPDYESDCICTGDQCCLVDNGLYVFGATPPAYIGPDKVDGGEYNIFTNCTLYDNEAAPGNVAFPPVGGGLAPINCTLDDGLLEDLPGVKDTENSGTYDRVIPNCPECTDVEPPVVIPCPIDPLKVDICSLFDLGAAALKMVPNIENSLVPLRVWENRPLTVIDQAPEVPFENRDMAPRRNEFVADLNRGPDPFDQYKYFIRLPLEYPRNGKFWDRAVAVANNQGYFSAPPQLSETQARPAQVRPLLYDEFYWLNPIDPGTTTYYAESYLVSTIRADTTNVEPGFTDSSIGFEDRGQPLFVSSDITDYDAFANRKALQNGDWRGEYFVMGAQYQLRTGFLTVDVADATLLEVPPEEYPVWDESRIKRPDIEFPDSVDQASLSNFVVSYAYFCTDFSAADDPVFDPNNPICWRQQRYKGAKSPNDGTAAFDPEADDCVPVNYLINTAYLLHPEIDETDDILGVPRQQFSSIFDALSVRVGQAALVPADELPQLIQGDQVVTRQIPAPINAT